MFWTSKAELALQLNLATNRALMYELQSFQDLRPRFFQKAPNWEMARQTCDEASSAFRDWLSQQRR
jgi:hypothetical protein